MPLMPDQQDEVVAMTHGFGAHRLILMPLAGRLRHHGYGVVNWGYASLWKGVERHAAGFRRVLERIEEDPETSRFHIVAHSMGNILARVVLETYQPTKLQRIVMLCPPNRGSHVAGLYAMAFGWLSQTLREITDRPDSYVNRLDQQIDPRFEVGIIRAKTDFVVREESTHLLGAKDSIELPGFHSSIVFRRQTAFQVQHFLHHGCFLRSTD